MHIVVLDNSNKTITRIYYDSTMCSSACDTSSPYFNDGLKLTTYDGRQFSTMYVKMSKLVR